MKHYMNMVKWVRRSHCRNMNYNRWITIMSSISKTTRKDSKRKKSWLSRLRCNQAVMMMRRMVTTAILLMIHKKNPSHPILRVMKTIESWRRKRYFSQRNGRIRGSIMAQVYSLSIPHIADRSSSFSSMSFSSKDSKKHLSAEICIGLRWLWITRISKEWVRTSFTITDTPWLSTWLARKYFAQ